MRILLAGLLTLLATACGINPQQPAAVHDLGWFNANSPGYGARGTKNVITVDAPKWLWDNHIHYRLLYSSPTTVRSYTLDRWIAPPPELFEQQLIASGKAFKQPLAIRLLDFEQQFESSTRARVLLHFSAEAYGSDNKTIVETHEFRLQQVTATADAAGAVSGFAELTRQAADRIQDWLTGLPTK